MFHPVTSSYLLLRAKWSIRQESYTAMCSLKNAIPARINNLMLCSQIESNVVSTGVSQTRWVDLHQPVGREGLVFVVWLGANKQNPQYQ